MSDFPAVQLHIITGKGGTGKSTVAASLALALASRGKTVLLCDIEPAQAAVTEHADDAITAERIAEPWCLLNSRVRSASHPLS